MVQGVTIAAVALAALAALAVERIGQSAQEEARYGVCQDYASRSQARAADRLVAAASRDLSSAEQGGSLYAAAKLGVVDDPAAMNLAQARLTAAKAAQAGAFATCARAAGG